ncbi:MAG: hypothetical protein QM791_17845 [Ferruginibacter sp.]
MKKYILICLALCIIAASAIAYYLYTDKGINIEKATAPVTTAAALYDMFLEDSVTAKSNYTGKIIAVTGDIKQVALNQQQKAVVLLETNTAGAAVNCTFEGDPGSLKTGSKTTIKGICTGLGEGDADLGIPGDVYLNRCYISKTDQ